MIGPVFMKLAHLSDFHFTRLTFNPLRLFPKRIFGHLNWLFGRKDDFCHASLDLLPSLFRALEVDLVLFAGDFTSSSMPEEFALAKSWLDKLSIPWIAVPGNHDCYTAQSKRKNLFFKVFQMHEKKVDQQKISDHLWVVSLDTALPHLGNSAQGLFSIEIEKQLEETLKKIPSSDQIIILNHYPFFQQESPHRTLLRGEALEELLRRHLNITLYLHGHTHRHSIADLRSDLLPIVLDSGSASLKKGTWNLIDLSDKKAKVTPYHLQEGIWNHGLTLDFVLSAPAAEDVVQAPPATSFCRAPI